MAPSGKSKTAMKAARTIADAAAWCCAMSVVALILVASLRENKVSSMRGNRFSDRPCDEIYEVREGETLHTISEKCGDPFIVERNPHICDPDDVFPGLVIKIIPLEVSSRKMLVR
ncbi:uncharacterized protein LOC115742720 [Rhodamnia argentea]|uniref:Uncharacterized protein LOC115742720 n=1 Tax=Rhodamnia argentea TaxID=178133 RepID=A0A8B8PG00_9MYRT|nr:uncharacterized protein LOC115742720 [Rhodamnia argentea]